MEPNSQQHTQQGDLDTQLKERFQMLPKVVQDAITSADVDAHLRKLADTHKLHLDQWQKLENEVMLALLGFEHVEDLEKNIQQEIGVTAEVAHALVGDVNTIVFEPIRQELERGLSHPEAQAAQVSGAEAARTQILSQSHEGETPPANVVSATPPAPVLQPATPPTPAPETKVARPSQSTEYRPGESSASRASVVDDPYREPPL